MEDRSLERIADECQRKTWEKRRSLKCLKCVNQERSSRVEEDRFVKCHSPVFAEARFLFFLFFLFLSPRKRKWINTINRIWTEIKKKFWSIVSYLHVCGENPEHESPHCKQGWPSSTSVIRTPCDQTNQKFRSIARRDISKKEKKNHRESDEDKWIGMTIPAIESRVNCKTVKGLDHVCKCQSPGASSLDRDETLAFRLTKMRASSSLDREI